ncbi:MAG TPA: hypothetical protein VJ969_06765 [Desulfopila sp.]|nr:hypothetical protein [Desulfopila sp.]
MAGSALAQLRMLIERHLRLISANPAIPSLLFSREIMVLNPYVRDALRDLTVTYQQRIEGLIQKGGRDGSLCGALEGQEFSFMLLSLLPGLSIHWIFAKNHLISWQGDCDCWIIFILTLAQMLRS